MSERWRCFVAVPIGEPLRLALRESLARWSLDADLAGLRWIEPEAWHVTLAFLGHVDADAVPDLAATVREVATAHARMRLATGGIGAFPSAGRARVVWYGVADPDRRLAGLAEDLREGLGTESADFRAHITLARARRQPLRIHGLIDRPSPAGVLEVDHVDLMRSHLGRGPARYERLATADLGVRVHA
jgi:RNA 2',3'-cyclic 3'-phosphodiesterase